MTAVADTSPLCYLILIGEIDLLPQLFSHVMVPRAVVEELLHEDAPTTVRSWATALPPWILLRDNPSSGTAGLERLQVGEQCAILLAELVNARLILLDEKSARRIAADRGLRVTGVLGILTEGAARGLVDLTTAVERLTKTNFRCSPALLKSILDQFERPRETRPA